MLGFDSTSLLLRHLFSVATRIAQPLEPIGDLSPVPSLDRSTSASFDQGRSSLYLGRISELERDLATSRTQIQLKDLELKVVRLESEAEHLRREKEIREFEFARQKEDLQREGEAIRAARAAAAISLFQGAQNISISGNSSFNIYWGRMAASPWITLIDATGEVYQLPEYFSWSYATFAAAIDLLLQRNTKSTNIQRSFAKRRMYSLCVDQGDKITLINSETSWLTVEQGTKIVMRVLIWRTVEPPTPKSLSYRYPLPHLITWKEEGFGHPIPIATTSRFIASYGCSTPFEISEHSSDGEWVYIGIPKASRGQVEVKLLEASQRFLYVPPVTIWPSVPETRC